MTTRILKRQITRTPVDAGAFQRKARAERPRAFLARGRLPLIRAIFSSVRRFKLIGGASPGPEPGLSGPLKTPVCGVPALRPQIRISKTAGNGLPRFLHCKAILLFAPQTKTILRGAGLYLVLMQVAPSESARRYAFSVYFISHGKPLCWRGIPAARESGRPALRYSSSLFPFSPQSPACCHKLSFLFFCCIAHDKVVS